MTDLEADENVVRRVHRILAILAARRRKVLELSIAELTRDSAERARVASVLVAVFDEVPNFSASLDDPSPPNVADHAIAQTIIGRVGEFEDAILDRFAKKASVRASVERRLAPWDPLSPPFTRGGERPELPDLSGQVIGEGRYRLIEKIGAGGMSVVYSAWQASTQQRVAVKILSRAIVSSDWHTREIQAATHVAHRAIVPIFDAGVSPVRCGETEVNVPWIAMQLVADSRTVTQFALEEKLNLAGRIELMKRVAEGLAFAHSEGLMHRDLKPANILVDRSGQPKLIDFGIARLESPAEISTRISNSAVWGTPAYMPPEEFSTGSMTAVERDIYAFGAILTETLTGIEWRKIRSADSTEYATILAALPRDIRSVVERTTAEAGKRTQTMQAVVGDLERVQRGERPSTLEFGPAEIIRWVRRNSLRAAAMIVIVALMADDWVGARSVRRIARTFEDDRIAAARQRIDLGLDRLAMREAESAIPELEAGIAELPQTEEAVVALVFAVLDVHGRSAALDRIARFERPGAALRLLEKRIRGNRESATATTAGSAQLTPAERFAAFRRSPIEISQLNHAELEESRKNLWSANQGFAQARFFFTTQLAAVVGAEGSADLADILIDEFRGRWHERGISWYWIAYLYGSTHRHAEALNAIDEARRRSVEYPALDINEIESLAQIGRTDEARKKMDALVARGVSGPFFDSIRGSTLFASGNFAAAADVLRRVVHEMPRCVIARKSLGVCLAQLQDFDGAEVEFRRCSEIDPSRDDIRRLLSDVFRDKAARAARAGLADRAREFATFAVEADPRSFDARLELSQILIERGRLAEAREHIEVVAKDAPRNSIALTQKAVLFAGEGDYVAAVRCAGNAVEESPEAAQPHTALVKTLHLVNDRAGIFRECCRWLDRDPCEARVRQVLDESRPSGGVSSGGTREIIESLLESSNEIGEADVWQRLLALKALYALGDESAAKSKLIALIDSIAPDPQRISRFLVEAVNKTARDFGF